MKYLNEEIKRKIMDASQNTVFLLKAPVGSGKTTFCLNDLWMHCRVTNKKLLLLVNRSALRGQLLQTIFKLIDMKNVPIPEKKIYEFDGLTVTSYQYFEGMLERNLNPQAIFLGAIKLQDFDFVVADEIHYILNDSLFSFTTYKLARMPEICNRAVRVYMSATIDPVRNWILEMEHVEDLYEKCDSELVKEYLPYRYRTIGIRRMMARNENDLKRDINEIHALEADFSYFIPNVLEKTEDLPDLILKALSIEGGKKWLIFSDSKESGRKLKQELIENGVTAAFISADELEAEDQMQRELLLAKQKFSVQVLIATAVLDNGISIVDKEVGNLVVCGYEMIQVIQQAGRIRIRNRAQKINLFVYRGSAELFNRRRFQLMQKLNAYKKFATKDEGEISRYMFEYGNQFANAVAQKSKNGTWKVNPYMKKALEYEIAELTEDIACIQSDPYGFVERVLRWFGMSLHERINEIQNKNQQDLMQFLEKQKDIPMDADEWGEFRKKFRIYFENATGKQLNSGRKDRIPGPNIVGKLMKEYGFRIDAKNRIHWIRKEVG